MTKLTTKLMIATVALVVVAGAATAQTLRASIPFEFRVGNRVMAAGTYRVDLSKVTGTKILNLLNVESGAQAILIAQIPVDPKQTWKAEGSPVLEFACTSRRCALAELWDGSGSYAYEFRGPKLGKDETADLREIPMRRDKGE